jgi:hypothetical protein
MREQGGSGAWEQGSGGALGRGGDGLHERGSRGALGRARRQRQTHVRNLSFKLMFGIFRPNAHLMFVVSVASGRYSAPKSPCNNQKDNIHFIGTAASKVRLALQASIPDSLSAIALQVAAAKVRLAVLSVLATVAGKRGLHLRPTRMAAHPSLLLGFASSR